MVPIQQPKLFCSALLGVTCHTPPDAEGGALPALPALYANRAQLGPLNNSGFPEEPLLATGPRTAYRKSKSSCTLYETSFPSMSKLNSKLMCPFIMPIELLSIPA